MKPRERARGFFELASRILADEESVAALFPVRPSATHGAVTMARREAVSMWQAFAPVFMARMSED